MWTRPGEDESEGGRGERSLHEEKDQFSPQSGDILLYTHHKHTPTINTHTHAHAH